MMRIITPETLKKYELHLRMEEKSKGTIEKYMRDIRRFALFMPLNKEIDKEMVIEYKEYLAEQYAISTANSMIAAINGLFIHMGWYELKVKPFKQQRKIFRDKERELTKAEYLRLLDAAKDEGNYRLFYIMETLCATGIRISELPYITVEAVNAGSAEVNCKGKQRIVLLNSKLRKALLRYCKEQRIDSGSVFITRTGKPMSRSNIWTEMKKLCAAANVDPKKVFPHNLRHLFAVMFYKLDKDIAKLADLLGHASIETTRIYIMESYESHIRLLEMMDLVI